MNYGLNALGDKAQLATQNTHIPKIDAHVSNKALKEQTDAFEAIIVKMLLDNAMKDQKDLFSSENDPGEKIYKSMYREELADASAGNFGFSQMLYNYLTQKQKNSL